jgi:hypothetical protein
MLCLISFNSSPGIYPDDVFRGCRYKSYPFYVTRTNAECREAILPGNIFFWVGFLIAQHVVSYH